MVAQGKNIINILDRRKLDLFSVCTHFSFLRHSFFKRNHYIVNKQVNFIILQNEQAHKVLVVLHKLFFEKRQAKTQFRDHIAEIIF